MGRRLNQLQIWTRVLFSDESRYNVSSADDRARIYRRFYDCDVDSCALERDRFGGGNVMVRGAMNTIFRSQLEIFNGTLSAKGIKLVAFC